MSTQHIIHPSICPRVFLWTTYALFTPGYFSMLTFFQLSLSMMLIWTIMEKSNFQSNKTNQLSVFFSRKVFHPTRSRLSVVQWENIDLLLIFWWKTEISNLKLTINQIQKLMAFYIWSLSLILNFKKNSIWTFVHPILIRFQPMGTRNKWTNQNHVSRSK